VNGREQPGASSTGIYRDTIIWRNGRSKGACWPGLTSDLTVFSPESGLRCFAKANGDTVIWETLGNRRRTVRRRLGHIAIIMAEPDAAPHHCLVIDISDGGVRVSTSHDFDVPNQFTLRRSGKEATYKVIWRQGRQVGAKLVSRASRRA